MTETFKSSEMIKIGGRYVCPDCKDHEQLSMDTVNIHYRRTKGDELDCKNLVVDDETGEVVGQCCCYSWEHSHYRECPFCGELTEKHRAVFGPDNADWCDKCLRYVVRHERATGKKRLIGRVE